MGTTKKKSEAANLSTPQNLSSSGWGENSGDRAARRKTPPGSGCGKTDHEHLAIAGSSHKQRPRTIRAGPARNGEENVSYVLRLCASIVSDRIADDQVAPSTGDILRPARSDVGGLVQYRFTAAENSIPLHQCFDDQEQNHQSENERNGGIEP